MTGRCTGSLLGLKRCEVIIGISGYTELEYVLGLLFLADVELFASSLALGEGVTAITVSLDIGFAVHEHKLTRQRHQ